MRTLSKNIKIDGAAPTSVEEMKQGELRLEEGGIFGRVGNQVLQKEWPVTLLYDDFEDGIIDSKWSLFTEKGGGTTEETGGELIITPVASGSGSVVALTQVDIELISQGVWVLGEFYFDIWGKVTVPVNPSGAFNVKTDFQFRDGVGAPKDLVAFYLTWNAGTFTYYLNYHDGANGGQTAFLSGLAAGPGVNEVWWRVRFLPGDAKINVFYSHKKSPHDIGWTDITSIMTYDPIPTGNITLDLQLRMQNLDPANPQSTYWNEIGNWVGEEISTTTTTTTTTT